MRLVPLPMTEQTNSMVWVNPEQVITVTLVRFNEDSKEKHIVYLALCEDLSYDVQFTSKGHAYEFIDELRK